MKKEIKIRGTTKSEEIEEIIKKMETIAKELKIESNVAVIITEKKNYEKQLKYKEFIRANQFNFLIERIIIKQEIIQI